MELVQENSHKMGVDQAVAHGELWRTNEKERVMKKNMLILSLLIIGGFAGKAEARYMANIAQHKEYESIQRKDYPHDCELLFAAFMGDIKLVVSALQSGANIYALDADGYTSGYIALSRHNFDVAKWIEA